MSPIHPWWRSAAATRASTSCATIRKRIELPIRIGEANDTLWLLERLNQSVQQDAVKVTIAPTNAVLVVPVEGVHACPR